MAETLGTLCDKLTIIKLKQWHTEDPLRLESLQLQERQLQDEINEFVDAARSGTIPIERLTFAADKVFKAGSPQTSVTGTFGEVFSQLAAVNCELWHEQEKVYEFEKVAVEEKDRVVKKLGVLNLARTACIDRIDRLLRDSVERGRRDAPSPER